MIIFIYKFTKKVIILMENRVDPPPPKKRRHRWTAPNGLREYLAEIWI